MDFELGDVILVDYESHGYSSASDFVFGWSADQNDGVMAYYDNPARDLMLEIH